MINQIKSNHNHASELFALFCAFYGIVLIKKFTCVIIKYYLGVVKMGVGRVAEQPKTIYALVMGYRVTTLVASEAREARKGSLCLYNPRAQ